MKVFPFLAPLFCIMFAACSGPKQTPDKTQGRVQNLSLDIEDLCETLPGKYYYFDEKQTDWSAACERAQPEILVAKTGADRLAVLERLVETLYDPHLTLGVNSASSPKLIPTGMDVATAFTDNNMIITGVRSDSPAADAGLSVGDSIVSFNGRAPLQAIEHRIGKQPHDAHHAEWGAQALFAGYHDQNRKIEYERNGVVNSVSLQPYKSTQPVSTITARRIENIGVIRLNNSLGQSETVIEFEEALTSMDAIDGLILDLRDTPSGGNTSVAEPILGMFVDSSRPYQETVYPEGSTLPATPKGDTIFEKPVIVLVGRWTGSMGEGMAIGFDGTGRAQVLGDKMAGLAGGTEGIELKRTGITIWVPTYDLRHLDGTPRHKWTVKNPRPADFGNGEDELLMDALSQFQ